MRPGQHSATPLSARSSYSNENQTCSSRVLVIPNAAKTRASNHSDEYAVFC